MRSFKHRINLISILTVLLLLFTLTDNSFYVKTVAKNVDDLMSESEKLKKEADRLEKIIVEQETSFANMKEYQSALITKKENAEKQVALYENQIKDLQNKIDELNLDISNRLEALIKIQQSIDSRFQSLGGRLRHLVKGSNFSDFQLLLKSENLQDYLIKTKMMSRLAKRDNDLIEGLNKDIEDIKIKKAQLEEAKIFITAQKSELETILKEQQKQKNEIILLEQKNSDLMKEISGEISHNHSALHESKEDLEKIEKNIQEIIEQAIREEEERNRTSTTTTTKPPTTTTTTTKPTDSTTLKPGETTSTTTTTKAPIKTTTTTVQNGGAWHGNYLLWPVPYTRNITSGYGSRWGTLHKGIDISWPGIEGKEVVAAADGNVIYTSINNPEGGGYGYYIMINHGSDQNGNNIVTLYAHNSVLLVSAGEKVKAGQVISKAGNTGDSTGAHLHFEVRVNSVAVDPISNKYVKP